MTCPSTSGYHQRTRANVRDSDATLILARGAPASVTALTKQFARQLQRPVLVPDTEVLDPAEAGARAVDLITARAVTVLNVAGPRASNWPSGAAYAEAVVAVLLRHVLSIRDSAS